MGAASPSSWPAAGAAEPGSRTAGTVDRQGSLCTVRASITSTTADFVTTPPAMDNKEWAEPS